MFWLAWILIGVSAASMAQESVESDNSFSGQTLGGAKNLEDRIKHIIKDIGQRVENDNGCERFQISGIVEIEAVSDKTDFNDRAKRDEKTSDVDLAVVALMVDARIVNHIDGHVVFKYEDDEILVDEGYITLSGPESLPFFLIAGRQYLPFGHFDSHFITDPTTLVLGETNEGAVIARYRFLKGKIDVSLGAFNGKARKTGDEDVIDSVVAGVSVNPFSSLMFGASYISNLAGSDAFSEVVSDTENLESLVSGWSAYAVFRFFDRFKLMGECVGALDPFEAGEIYDASDTRKRRPMAWNAEFGFAISDGVEIAARYGGSDDGDAFLPETQYGPVFNWGVFEKTTLAIEYLHSEFENGVQDTDRITVQLAVEF